MAKAGFRLLLSLLLIACVVSVGLGFLFVLEVRATGSSVGTSTTIMALDYPCQKATFYDAINGYHYLFYSNASGTIGYESSSDGVTWTGAFNVMAGPFSADSLRDFSLWWNGSYVSTAYTDDSQVYYCEGPTNSSGLITWAATRTAVATVANIYYYSPFVFRDSSGYPLIGFIRFKSNAPIATRVYVVQATTITGSAWAASVQLSATSDANWKVTGVPLTSRDAYIIYGRDGQPILGAFWNSTAASWTKDQAVSASSIVIGDEMSAIGTGNDVYLVFTKVTTHETILVNRTSNAWNAEVVLAIDGVDYPAIVLNAPDFYVFVANATFSCIYGKNYTGGVWGASWLVSNTSAYGAIHALTASYEATSLKVSLAWEAGAASPYTIIYYGFDLPSNQIPTIGAASGTNWDDTDNCYAQKKAYTVSVTYSDADNFADIQYCELFLKTGGNVTRAEFWFLEDSNTLGTASGSTQWTLDSVAGDFAKGGDDIAGTWKFTAQWDATNETGLGFLFFVNDTLGASVNSVDAAGFDVVTRLINNASTPVADDGMINQAGSAAITATIKYADDPNSYVSSSSYPPDAEFTSLSIHNSTHSDQATNSSVSNGEAKFSFTIPDAAQNNLYHVFINMSDADYTDADAVDDTTVGVIGDNLTVFNLQPVQYLGSGDFKYEAQIKYGYLGVLISGGYVDLEYPNGTLVGKTSSNATGWVTFIVGQLNSTSGAFNLYGENETAYAITYPGANQTFANYYWALAPQDVAGNSLTNTNHNVTLGATAVWSGTATSVYVPPDTFNLTVTWLQNLPVNSTVNVPIVGDTTTNLNCTCYPYVIGATRYWTASNATITSSVYASYLLTVKFSCALDSYVLVASYTTYPAYVLNVTYNMTIVFASGYLVMPHFGNMTIVASYENWAGLYVKYTDRTMWSVGWAGYQLNIVTNGTVGDVGELDVYCASRGQPVTTSGFTVTSYVGGVFTGLYTFTNTSATVSLEWTVASSNPTGETTQAASLFITLAFTFPKTVQSGATVDGFLNVSWMGAAKIYIWSVIVDSDYAKDWELQIARLPWTLETLMQNGRVQVPVVLYITGTLAAGNYSVPCDVTFNTVEGVSKTVRTIFTFEVTIPMAEVPSMLVYVFLIGISLVVTSGLFLGTQKRRKYSQ